MKILPVSLNFCGNTNKYDNYQKEIENKSQTTVKLAIGTAITGGALLAAYYLTRGKKPPVKSSTTTKIQPPRETLQNIKGILDKTPETTIAKINNEVINAINNIQIKKEEFSERLITVLKNGKCKVSYSGKQGGNIKENALYISPKGELQSIHTKFSNGTSIIKKFKNKTDVETIEKLFYDKNGKLTKKIYSSTELQYTAKIPTHYIRRSEVFSPNKTPLKRITTLSLDMKPKRTISASGKKIYYCYSRSNPHEVIGHATSDNGKLTLKFLNNAKFSKKFKNIEELRHWAKDNIRV